MSETALDTVWLTADEQHGYAQALQSLPQATIYSGACMWLMYRLAELQGRRLGTVRCKLWQLNSLNLIYSLTAIYSGYLFHVLSGEGSRTLGRLFAYSPAHVALMPWLLGFLVVEYFVVKARVEGLDEGVRIGKLFRSSIGCTFIILQQVYPTTVGMHWIHWLQLCEARHLFSSLSWMMAAKTFSEAIRGPLHALNRVAAFGCLVGTVAASLWAGQYMYQNKMWSVEGLPDSKHRLTLVHMGLLAFSAVLLTLAAWGDYQALKDGPVTLEPLAEEEGGTEQKEGDGKVLGQEFLKKEGGEAEGGAKAKSNVVTSRKTKGQRKYT